MRKRSVIVMILLTITGLPISDKKTVGERPVIKAFRDIGNLTPRLLRASTSQKVPKSPLQ